MTYTHNTITLGGVDIQYAEAPGIVSALVLLHGITDSLDTYLPLLGELSGWAHVYALDLRGHGGSSNVGSYRVRDYTDDVAAFVQAVIGAPAVVAGHSLGGLVAAALAADAPALVRGVLLEDPPMYLGDMWRFRQTAFYDGFVALRRMLHDHAAAGGEFADLIMRVGQQPAGDGRTLAQATSPEDVRYRAEQLDHLDPRALDAAIDGSVFYGFEPDDVLAQIRCPVHLLAGQADLGSALIAADVERLVHTVPDCTVAMVNDVGHGIHGEQPRVYLDELQQFWQRLHTT
jgi:pimeloyl-ACP methyl ester carboxylesterase